MGSRCIRDERHISLVTFRPMPVPHELLHPADPAPPDSPGAPGAPIARSARWRAGIRWWAGRYGLAEVGGIGAALTVSAFAREWSSNEVVAAYAAAIGETVGYYAVIIGREISEALAQREARWRGKTTALPTPMLGRLRRLALEFGPAEAADILVLRPAAVGACTRLFGVQLGVTMGKVVADVVFYSAVVTAYRIQRPEAGAPASPIGDAGA